MLVSLFTVLIQLFAPGSLAATIVNPGFIELPYADPSYSGLKSETVKAFFQNGDVLLIGTDRGLFISNTKLETFDPRTVADGLGSDIVNSIFADGTNIYVATDEGFSVSHDNGQTFKNFFVKEKISDVLGDGGNIYLRTYAGRIHRSRDNGLTFSDITPAKGPGNCRGIAASQGNFYLSCHGGTYRSTDGGENYTDVKGFHPSGVYVLAASGNNLYGNWGGGKVISSSDNGETAQEYRVSAGEMSSIEQIFADYQNGTAVVYVGTWGNGLFRSDDSGRSFQRVADFPFVHHSTPLYVKGANVYTSPHSPYYGEPWLGIQISSDDGKNWQRYFPHYGPPSRQITDAVVEGDDIYVTSRRGLSMSRDGGRSFDNNVSALINYAQVNDIIRFGKALFALGRSDGGIDMGYEVLALSTDNGQTFQNTPPKSLFVEVKNKYVFKMFQTADTPIGYGPSLKDDFEVSGDGVNYEPRQGLAKRDFFKSSCGSYVVTDVGDIFVMTCSGLQISKDGGKTFQFFPVDENFSALTSYRYLTVSGSSVVITSGDNVFVSSDEGRSFFKSKMKVYYPGSTKPLISNGLILIKNSQYEEDESFSYTLDGGRTFAKFPMNSFAFQIDFRGDRLVIDEYSGLLVFRLVNGKFQLTDKFLGGASDRSHRPLFTYYKAKLYVPNIYWPKPVEDRGGFFTIADGEWTLTPNHIQSPDDMSVNRIKVAGDNIYFCTDFGLYKLKEKTGL